MNQEITELKSKIKQKDEDIKNIVKNINEKDKAINDMNKKIVELENNNKYLFSQNELIKLEFNDKLNHINKNISNLYNKKERFGKLNDKIKEQNDFIKKSNDIIDGRLKNIEANINSKIEEKINQMIIDKNNFELEGEKKGNKEKQNKEKQKIEEKNIKDENKGKDGKKHTENKIKEDNDKIDGILGDNREIKVKDKNIEEEIEIQKDQVKENNKNHEINNNIMPNNIIEYEQKINHMFVQDPKNLKSKCIIATTCTKTEMIDIFEIFTSYKDNSEYLVTQNAIDYKLEIFSLLNKNKIKTVSGHGGEITVIRYFIKHKDKNEYLISGDKGNKVIIWDINDDYNIKQNLIIEPEYINMTITSCLLIFPNYFEDIFITSYYRDLSGNIRIYSLNKKEIIRNINNRTTYYLLTWYNKINNKYYIIQFTKREILISDLFEEEIYSKFFKKDTFKYLNGFIYYKDKNDYLCTLSSNNDIMIYDLYGKTTKNTIKCKTSKLNYIIDWNSSIFIFAHDGGISKLDLEKVALESINDKQNQKLICLKKIYHPIYGESIFSADEAGKIIMWTIE